MGVFLRSAYTRNFRNPRFRYFVHLFCFPHLYPVIIVDHRNTYARRDWDQPMRLRSGQLDPRKHWHWECGPTDNQSRDAPDPKEQSRF